MLEVIPMRRSKAYASVAVNRVDPQALTSGRQGQAVVVGIDIGKFQIRAVPRWADGTFGRPWRIDNPQELPQLVQLLGQLAPGRSLAVALEPSGTYGDALRQALSDRGVAVWRVSPKAAHDYAEVFDGVPSQHDGKDAAVVAELAALGKAAPWPYVARPAWEQELAYWVDWLDAQRLLLMLWAGRLEGLLGRHWPEATRVLKVTSGTLLRVLAHYGGPQALAADAQAAARLAGWGGPFLQAERVQQLLQAARSSVGVRLGQAEAQRLRVYAEQALAARLQMRQCQRQLQRLVRGRPVLEAQAKAVGAATACVLWASVGDPHDYPCGPAYRKAMGLNLAERSSGTYQGTLRLSKRGSPQVRRWLYLAALRLVKQAGVRAWYQAKKARDGQEAKRAVVGVMRKLALALYRVGVGSASFEASQLFPGQAASGGPRGKGDVGGE
jgi:transposase